MVSLDNPLCSVVWSHFLVHSDDPYVSPHMQAQCLLNLSGDAAIVTATTKQSSQNPKQSGAALWCFIVCVCTIFQLFVQTFWYLSNEITNKHVASPWILLMCYKRGAKKAVAIPTVRQLCNLFIPTKCCNARHQYCGLLCCSLWSALQLSVSAAL